MPFLVKFNVCSSAGLACILGSLPGTCTDNPSRANCCWRISDSPGGHQGLLAPKSVCVCVGNGRRLMLGSKRKNDSVAWFSWKTPSFLLSWCNINRVHFYSSKCPSLEDKLWGHQIAYHIPSTITYVKPWVAEMGHFIRHGVVFLWIYFGSAHSRIFLNSWIIFIWLAII